MVIMDAYYSPERMIELWQIIDQLHLSYLQMEESSKKMDHRNKLEGCIRDYLCIASHAHKFFFPETAEVLYRSASNKKDFSAYKAVTGWNAIQLYAGNLLSQPWRKEYRTVKTYCGFYKHQIEANLVGAEIMFEAMGYKHEGGGILVIDGPICPDRVTNVSKDCLIAYVECQIIKTIWEKISQSITISWLDVLDFRKAYAGSAEESILALSYQLEQQKHTRSFSQDHNFAGRYQLATSIPNSHQLLSSNHSFPPLSGGHTHLPIPPAPLPPPQYYCAANCPNNYATYGMPHSYRQYPAPIAYASHQSIVKPPPSYATNGYYCTNGHHQPPHYGYAVPTAQLIELEAHNNCSYGAVDNPNHYPHRNTRSSPPPPEARKMTEKQPNNVAVMSSGVRVGNRDSDRENSQYEDWDYVYRDLESQGYSKDLGERGDILSPTMSAKRRKNKPTNLDEALNTLTVSDNRPLKMTEALDKFDNDTNHRKISEGSRPAEKKPSQSSSYENLSESKTKSQKVIKTKSIGSSAKINKIETFLKLIDPPKRSPNNGTLNNNNNVAVGQASNSKVVVNNKDKWECKACTYHNDDSSIICEICSKTRTNIEQKMEIGGAECSECTLVNPKDKKVCEACGSSLVNSPTYI